jgi:hypothetical protein
MRSAQEVRSQPPSRLQENPRVQAFVAWWQRRARRRELVAWAREEFRRSGYNYPGWDDRYFAFRVEKAMLELFPSYPALQYKGAGAGRDPADSLESLPFLAPNLPLRRVLHALAYNMTAQR